MADANDVQNALVTLASAAIYPNGTGQSSITGFPTLVFPGWPNAQQLNQDMAALAAGTGGKINVSVFATNIERNVSRYWRTTPTAAVPAATLTLTINANTVTVGGTVSTPQTAMIKVNGQPYFYAVQPTDTLNTIATALAGLVTGASASGAVITVPTSARLQADRVGVSATAQTEVGRQSRVFQIIVWAHTPAARASTVSAIDAAMKAQDWLTFPDGTSGRMIYRGSPQDDMTQKAGVYRRDLNYEVEFATTQASTLATVLAVGITETVKDVQGDVIATPATLNQ